MKKPNNFFCEQVKKVGKDLREREREKGILMGLIVVQK
jgi:hypothetical protein